MPTAKRPNSRRLARAALHQRNKQSQSSPSEKHCETPTADVKGDDRINGFAKNLTVAAECGKNDCKLSKQDSKEDLRQTADAHEQQLIPTSIKIQIKIPDNSCVEYSGYSSDIANVVLITILDTTKAYEYSSSQLLADGKVLSETSPLPLGPDVKYSLEMRPYTERDAKNHVIRVHALFYGPPPESRDIISFPAEETLNVHIYSQEFAAETLEAQLLGWKPRAQRKKGFAEIKLSSWSPPPHKRRLRGDYFYINITTLSGDVLEITACARGFYLNSSTQKNFDPKPVSETYLTLPKLLAAVCKKFSPVYRDALELFSEESLSKKSCLRESASAALLPINWIVPESLDDTAHDSLKTFSVSSCTQSQMESVATDMPRDWNEEVQAFRTLYVASRDAYMNYSDKLTEAHEIQIAKRQELSESPDTLNASCSEASGNEIVLSESLASSDATVSEKQNAEGPEMPEFFDVSIANQNFRQMLETRLQFATTAASGVVAAANGVLIPLAGTNVKEEDAIFLYSNILLTKVESNYRRFEQSCADPVLAARMAAVHENEGLAKIENCRVEGLHTIPSGLVDYCGLRYSVQAVVPGFLSYSPSQKIIYGPSDNYFGEVDANLPPDTKLSFDRQTHDIMGTLASKLYWKEHDLPLDSANEEKGTIKFWPSFDTRVLAGLDGRKYVLEVHRITPFDEQFMRNCRNDDIADDYPLAHPPLRPELLEIYSRENSKSRPNNDDESTPNSQPNEADALAKKDSAEAKQLSFNLDTHVKGLEKFYSSEDENDVQSLLQFLYNSIIPQFAAKCLDNTKIIPNGKILASYLHEAGISIRHLGILTQYAEKFTHFADTKRFPKIRFFGSLLRRELLTRSFKHIAHFYLAAVAGSAKVPAVVSKLLTTLMSTTGPKVNRSPKSWAKSQLPSSIDNLTPDVLIALITRDMAKRYRYKATPEMWKFDRKIVLVTSCNVLGIQLAARNYGTRFEIAEEDVLNIAPIVRTFSDTSEICLESMFRTKLFAAHVPVAETIESLEQAWGLYETSYGHVHPQSMKALYSLIHAITAICENQLDSSVEMAHIFDFLGLYTTTCERLHGIDSIEAITGHQHMAMLYTDLQRFEHGICHAEQMLRLLPSRVEYDNPDCIPFYDCAARLFGAVKRDNDALRLWQLLKEITEPMMKVAQLQYAEVCKNLANCLFRLGMFSDASKNAQIAFEITTSALGNEHATTIECGKLVKQSLERSTKATKSAKQLMQANASQSKSIKKKLKENSAANNKNTNNNDNSTSKRGKSTTTAVSEEKGHHSGAECPKMLVGDSKEGKNGIASISKPAKKKNGLGKKPQINDNDMGAKESLNLDEESKKSVKIDIDDNSPAQDGLKAADYDLSVCIADCELDSSKPFQVVGKSHKSKSSQSLKDAASSSRVHEKQGRLHYVKYAAKSNHQQHRSQKSAETDSRGRRAAITSTDSAPRAQVTDNSKNTEKSPQVVVGMNLQSSIDKLVKEATVNAENLSIATAEKSLNYKKALTASSNGSSLTESDSTTDSMFDDVSGMSKLSVGKSSAK